jgi:hypothetical protein
MVLVSKLVGLRDNLGVELEQWFMLGELLCESYTFLRVSLLLQPFIGYLASQKNFPNLQILVSDQAQYLNRVLRC